MPFEDAKAAEAVPLKGRVDYRDVPLVTIDGADARDFDDAVWAERLPEGAGFRILVAIADVAHYVRPQSPLDQEAKKRGNSCYFPDRVIPMLPENLSKRLVLLGAARRSGMLGCRHDHQCAGQAPL